MNLEMIPIEIIGLKKDLQAAVHALRNLGCMQIDDLTDSPEVSARPLILDHETLRRQEDISFLLAQTESLLSALGGKKELKNHPPAETQYEEAKPIVEALLPKVQNLTLRREKLEAEKASLPRYEATLRKLLPIIPASARDPANSSVGVLVSRAHVGVLDSVGKRVLELSGGKADIVASDVDSFMRAMLIVFPREYTSEIETLLGGEDISRLRLPAGLGEGPPDMVLAALYRRMAAIPEEIKEVRGELESLAAQWSSALTSILVGLRNEVETHSVLSKFGETDLTFVLVGWVPVNSLETVKSTLQQTIGQSLLVQPLELSLELKKHAPVVLQNPALARPFESLVELLALPRYGHIDPTCLMALFLPVFFGMILGDIGYGAVLLVLILVLMRKFRSGMLRNLLAVMRISAGWSILFGFLYGELFGTLGEHIGLHALWIDRASSEDVDDLLLMTLIVGSIHVTLGLILGIWEAARDHSRDHLFERCGMLLGLISVFVLLGAALKMLPPGFTAPAGVGLLAGIVLLGFPMGKLGPFIGAIEFIGLIGNILSYLRIAAIGLASVYLAKVANDVAGMMGGFLASAVVLVLVHGLNLVLGAFSPTIHSLRLNYVEFFRKFYEGGGRPYLTFRNSLAGEEH